jgi:hypothetical protein
MPDTPFPHRVPITRTALARSNSRHPHRLAGTEAYFASGAILTRHEPSAIPRSCLIGGNESCSQTNIDDLQIMKPLTCGK